MSIIKDIFDLTSALINSSKDKKFSAEILQIQSFISDLQSNNSALVTENLELKKKIMELEQTILNLNNKQRGPFAKIIHAPNPYSDDSKY